MKFQLSTNHFFNGSYKSFLLDSLDNIASIRISVSISFNEEKQSLHTFATG